MADNTQVDAITGKAVRMDGEMVNVSTNTGTGAIGLQTWETAHTKRVVQRGLPCCCCATTATEAELLEEATMNKYDWTMNKYCRNSLGGSPDLSFNLF